LSGEAAKPRRRRRVLVIAGLLVAALATSAIVMRFTLFVPFKVPSGSMWPTIVVGQHITANRFDRTPRRGAVVVFRFPEHREQTFVKRIVGLEGDEVSVHKGRLFINGWEVPHCIVGRTAYVNDDDKTNRPGDLEVEFLDGAAYLLFHEGGVFEPVDQGPWVVKRGEYFVMGDNRENAFDSRMWFAGHGGGVPLGNTIGIARVDVNHPTVPPGGPEKLPGSLEQCLRNPPPSTPPPPKR
jgi:signal peptidase I